MYCEVRLLQFHNPSQIRRLRFYKRSQALVCCVWRHCLSSSPQFVFGAAVVNRVTPSDGCRTAKRLTKPSRDFQSQTRLYTSQTRQQCFLKAVLLRLACKSAPPHSGGYLTTSLATASLQSIARRALPRHRYIRYHTAHKAIFI
jgi:hypothetical protein